MRAVWSNRQNCSHNVSQRFKRIRRFSEHCSWNARYTSGSLPFPLKFLAESGQTTAYLFAGGKVLTVSVTLLRIFLVGLQLFEGATEPLQSGWPPPPKPHSPRPLLIPFLTRFCHDFDPKSPQEVKIRSISGQNQVEKGPRAPATH